MTVRVSDSTLRWLHNSLTTYYRDVNRTYSDVAQVLSVWPGLKPCTEQYTYEDGTPALLLLVRGQVPVDWQGSTYKYPIELWVPHTYPRDAPIVYVRPVPGTVVRPGQHVSLEGRIYHPFLAQWSSQPERSSLTDLVFVLRDTFAREPPARAVGPGPAPARATPGPQTAQSGPARPPKRNDAQHIDQSGRATPSSGPPLPPKPGQSASTPPVASPYSDPRARPPPLPASGGMPWQREAPTPAAISQHAPYSQPLSPHNAQQHVQPQGQFQPQGGYFGGFQPRQAPQNHASPAPTPANYPQHGDRSLPQGAVQNTQQQPRVKQPVPDLMDSPLEVILPSQNAMAGPVAAPPIPPNPEKDALLQTLSTTICEQVEQMVAQNEAAIPQLESQYAALQQAHRNLHAELAQLDELDKVLVSNEKILHETMREADSVSSSISQREVPSIDQVLVAPTVVGEQLYQLVSEEQSISDALFLLARALDRGRVGADVFVKQTRSLAREQFLKKALVRKIGHGMGLTPE